VDVFFETRCRTGVYHACLNVKLIICILSLAFFPGHAFFSPAFLVQHFSPHIFGPAFSGPALSASPSQIHSYVVESPKIKWKHH